MLQSLTPGLTEQTENYIPFIPAREDIPLASYSVHNLMYKRYNSIITNYRDNTTGNFCGVCVRDIITCVHTLYPPRYDRQNYRIIIILCPLSHRLQLFRIQNN